MKTNVILVDDHKMFLEGLESVIRESPEISVLGTAMNGKQGLSIVQARCEEIDIIVVDVSMPVMDGVEFMKIVKHLYPQIKILALTMHNDENRIRKLKEVGVDGYILKEDSHEELVTAIRALRKGDDYFGTEVMKTIMQSINNKSKDVASPLTARELEVLKLIGKALSGPEIASRLNISVNTVETHRRNILIKLNMKNSLELVRYAVKNGIVD